MSQYVVLELVGNQCAHCGSNNYRGVNLGIFSGDLEGAVDTLAQSMRVLLGSQNSTSRWMGLQAVEYDRDEQRLSLCPRIYLIQVQQGRVIERRWAESSLHE